jgi:hypothetical protein
MTLQIKMECTNEKCILTKGGGLGKVEGTERISPRFLNNEVSLTESSLSASVPCFCLKVTSHLLF